VDKSGEEQVLLDSH